MTNKAIVGGFIGLLAEIATSDGRLDEAETLLQQALALSKDHSPYANCAARLALLRGQVDVATRYLNIASAGYRKNHRPPSPYHDGLRAWLVALQGEVGSAQGKIEAAIARVPADQVTDLAELQLVHGYIQRSQNQRQESRNHFRRAAELDTRGINAITARHELEASAWPYQPPQPISSAPYAS